MRTLGTETGPWDRVCPPRYSTDIAAAWQVVEKIGWQFKIKYDGMDQCGVVFGNEIDEKRVGWTYDKSTPRAICLAALKAVGVEVPA